ncbi:ABC transporter substrate-binding protein [Kozakia baliensis]|uniref:ABC transporter substrate-binding protein n=1 Tax=Kozakia baliensis TaxID=153496 RepID=UPI001314D094|nr:ABC transporter substrate-binding protein [Kozakia baliensis]
MPRIASATTASLSIGDQNDSTRSLLEASGQAANLPYKLEWHQFSQAQTVLQVQNAGAVEFSRAGDVAFLFACAAGAPLLAVGGSRSGGNAAAILVRGDSSIQDIRQLRGRSVALSRAGLGEPFLYGALERAGMQRTDVRVVNVQQHVARMALATGEVDAWVTWHPYVALGVIEDHARILVTAKNILSFYVFDIVRRDTLASKIDIVTDFRKRISRALAWSRENPDRYAQIYSTTSHLPLKVARSTVDVTERQPIKISDGVITNVQNLYQKMRSLNLVSQNIDVHTVLSKNYPI